MHVEHFEKGVKYSDQDLLVLARKIGKLATYCRRLKDDGSSIRVEAEAHDTKKSRDNVKVMVTVHLPKSVLRAESLKYTALEALDRCVEKLETQIKRYKDAHTAVGKVRMSKHRNKNKGE